MSSFQVRRNASLVYNSISPIFTEDVVESENPDSAFHGFSGTALTQSEIVGLIDSMRRDEVETFEGFRYEHIQNFRTNVVLSQLQCMEYMASSFWKVLYGVNLLQMACIFSAHSIISSILKHDAEWAPTKEEVSAVHICGAMGDYAGLRKLLKADFSPVSQDILGRTPLHYAAQTNLPIVVMLLSKDLTLQYIQDKFVRMADDTRMEDLEKLFFRIWRLRKPGLVLSLHGSVPMGRAYQKSCYGLIFGVLQKTLTWIITDGQYGSVSEVMSLGMSGHAEAYRLNRLQVIGIVPWRRLPFQADLRSLNYMGSTQVVFPQKGPKTELHTPLAPYHTRYLFVDSGPRNDIHCIQEFRTRFEMPTHIATTVAPVEDEAQHPRKSVAILSYGRVRNPEEYLPLESAQKLLEIMLRYWPKTSPSEELTALVATILSYSHLMQFFFAESDSDASLEGKIVSALINPALFRDAGKKQSWKPWLRLAMELNKTDFVLEGILADSPWTLEEISPFAKCCLLANKPRFLRLFCDVGLHMYEFADRKTVEELFTIETHRNTVGGRALKQFFLYHIRKVPASITVDVVEQTLKIMMGRKYFTHVTRNDHRCRCVMRKLKESSSNQQGTGVEEIVKTSYLHENESYLQYLYLWALASKRYEIARYLLMMLTDITAAALFGASFLRRKARIARSLTAIEELKNYSLVFENIALSILNQCYSSNVESTMQLLVMERQTFEHLSCFVIAAEGNCKHFMEHQACQEYLDRVWAHTLFVRVSSTKRLVLFSGIELPTVKPNGQLFLLQLALSAYFFFSLFVGMVCPPAIPFIADYDETKYAQKSSDSVNDVAYSVLFCLFAIDLQFEFASADYGWMAVKIATIVMTTAHLIDYVKNVVRDLLPFLVIVLIFWSMYTIIFSVIILRPSCSCDAYGAISRLLRIMQSGFFQMFGEFNLEELLRYYGNSTCGNVTTPGCTYPYFKFLLPMLLSLFTLTTHVLLINLLIAIFTIMFIALIPDKRKKLLPLHSRKTYDDMEAKSRQLWTMQRYELMGSILSQSFMPATLSIFPLIYQCFQQKSFQNSPGCGRQLINWEKLNALIITEGGNCSEEMEGKKGVERDLRGAACGHQEGHWHLLHRLQPSDIKTGLKKNVLEQKITNIGKTLESIMALLKTKYHAPLSPPSPTTKLGMANSLVFSGQSLCSESEGQEPPISFQWQNHQLAFYATLISDITPRSLDPPIPWDDPFPEYSPIHWQPSSNLIPAWQTTVGETSPSILKTKRVSYRILSLDSTAMLATSSSPARSVTTLRNPEGRVGIAGKGLLPLLGGNTACIVVVERSGFSDIEEVLLLRGVRAQAQFPWFLCHHGKDCSRTSCYKELVREFCKHVVATNEKPAMIDAATLQRFFATYNKHVYVGPVSDPINCDNAWLEVTVVHFKIIPPFSSICNVERIFKIKGGMTAWARLDDLPPMRKSHLEGLKAIHVD
ncbi:Transient receptor potential cation channel subfamily M member 8 [Taenia solium]|eukprot:TsM_000893200 transcript=TsM_000893200 gene=TsM_000893200